MHFGASAVGADERRRGACAKVHRLLPDRPLVHWNGCRHKMLDSIHFML